MLSRYVLVPGKGRAILEQEEVSLEKLQPNEAVIQAEATMISAGTELSRVFEIKQGFSYPVRPGYSAVGKVLAKGSGLTDLEVGDRVFYSGPHASISRFSRGSRTQGPKIFKLPAGILPKEGPLLALGLVAMSGVNLVEVKLGDKAAVFGLGVLGLMTGILLQNLGAEVVGVDPVEARCQLASEVGFSHTVNVPPQEQVRTLMDQFGGMDLTVDVSGQGRAIESAVLACKKYGQVLLLGTPREACEMDVTPMMNAIHMRMLKVIGGFNSVEPVAESEGMRLNVARDFETLTTLLLAGKLDFSSLISHVIKPEEVERAYHGLMYEPADYRCVVIDWS